MARRSSARSKSGAGAHGRHASVARESASSAAANPRSARLTAARPSGRPRGASGSPRRTRSLPLATRRIVQGPPGEQSPLARCHTRASQRHRQEGSSLASRLLPSFLVRSRLLSTAVRSPRLGRSQRHIRSTMLGARRATNAGGRVERRDHPSPCSKPRAGDRPSGDRARRVATSRCRRALARAVSSGLAHEREMPRAPGLAVRRSLGTGPRRAATTRSRRREVSVRAIRERNRV